MIGSWLGMMGGMEPADMLAMAGASMQKRPGCTLNEWADLVSHTGLDPLLQNGVRGWLEDVHGLPQNTQWSSAQAAARRGGWVEPTAASYMDTMYDAAKASLCSLHDGVGFAQATAWLHLGADSEGNDVCSLEPLLPDSSNQNGWAR